MPTTRHFRRARRLSRALVVLTVIVGLLVTGAAAAAKPSSGGAPVNTAAPSISGSAVVGSTLSAGAGSWSGQGNAYSFGWSRCNAAGAACSSIAGTSQPFYAVAAADLGSTLKVAVRASNTQGASSASSAATSVVVPALTGTAAVPSASGATVVAPSAATIVASDGSVWGIDAAKKVVVNGVEDSITSNVVELAYVGGKVWQENASKMWWYKVKPSDAWLPTAGTATSPVVQETATTTPPPTTTTTTVSVPLALPVSVVLPVVSGSVVVGGLLSASSGSWSGVVSGFGFQWQRCVSGLSCVSVSGATGSAYSVSAGDVGSGLRVVVSAVNASGSVSAGSVVSAMVPPVVAPAAVSSAWPRYGTANGSKLSTRTSADQDWEIAQDVALGAKIVRFDFTGDTTTAVTLAKLKAAGIAPDVIVAASLAPGGMSTAAFAAEATDVADLLKGFPLAFEEMMNEPDLHGWSPATYTPYLQAGYLAAKAADPSVEVLNGGIWKYLFNGTSGATSVDWVKGMYAAGAKGYFDAMNLHLYDDPAQHGLWSAWDMAFGSNGAGFYDSSNVRSVMNANGDSSVPIVTTEAGGPVQTYGTAGQATIVTNALGAADGVGTGYRKLAFTLIYNVRDDDVPGYGLLDPNNVPRPSWQAFKTAASK